MPKIFFRITFYFLTAITLFNVAYSSPPEECSKSNSSFEIYLVGVYLFEGDRHGEFCGDVVAVLSDGSHWKIHPKQTVSFGSWQPGDVVKIHVRTSFYWFKREHKFYLENLEKNAKIKVMLIDYGDASLEIVKTSQAYPTATRNEPIQILLSYNDSQGNPQYYWQTIGYKKVPCNYVKELILSDGKKRIITKQLGYFTEGKTVYIVHDQFEDQKESLLITGTEREAVWSSVK